MDERRQEGLRAAMGRVLILLLHPRKDLILQLWWLSRGQIFKERSNSVYWKNWLWEFILHEGCRTEPLVVVARCYSSPAPSPASGKPHSKQESPNISHLKICQLKLHFSIFFGAIYYQMYLMPNLTWFLHFIMLMKYLSFSEGGTITRSCSLA